MDGYHEVLLDQASDAIIVADAETGYVIDANERAQALTGLTLTALQERRAWDLQPPDERREAEAHFLYCLRRGEGRTDALSLLHRDGTRTPVEITARVLTLGRRRLVLGLLRDLTAQQAARRRLQLSDQRYQVLMEDANDAILLADARTGRLVEANRKAEELTGRSRETLQTLHHWDLHPASERALARSHFEAGIQQGQGRTEGLHLLHRDGHLTPVEISASVVEVNGQRLIMGLFRDISARRAAEQAAQRRDAILEAVGFAAEALLESNHWERTLQEVLRRLGEATTVSRLYIFENVAGEDGALCASQRHEWTAPGVEPQLDNPYLQNASYEALGCTRWAEQLSRHHTLYGPVEQFPQAEAEMLREQGIRSLAVVPIFEGERWWGFMGYDDCTTARVWSRGEVQALRVAANMLGAAIKRRRDETSLRESEARWRKLAKHNPVPIVIHAAGEVAYMNPAGTKLLLDAHGVPRDALIDVICFRDISQHPLKAWTECEQTAQVRVVTSGGPGLDQRVVEIKDVMITLDGHEAVLSVIHNITDQWLFEEQLMRAKEEAETASQFKTHLLANMSHEIRTPLTSILGFAEIIAEEEEGRTADFAHIIQEGGQRLYSTLNAILDLSELESKNFNVSMVPTCLRERAEAAVQRFAGSAKQGDLTLELEAEPGLEVRSFVDPEAIDRVLDNLISNAIKFTEVGGVTVRLATTKTRAQIHVIDSGVGIGPDFLPHIFEEFRQESSGANRHFEGCGLGLTIAKRLVEKMDGTITVTSRSGMGSTFTISFPNLEAADTERSQLRLRVARQIRRFGRPGRAVRQSTGGP